MAKYLKISNGSAYVWTKKIILTDAQRKAIQARKNKHIFSVQDRRVIGKRLALYRKKYSKQDLLAKITRFYQQNGRIPLKHEFNSHRSYRTHFGSWNNAIRLAGFEPNSELFAKRVHAHDGHICDSFAEKIIDDWLSQRKIKHVKNFFYQGTKMTADFYVENQQIYIEYFGLRSVNKKYDKSFLRKVSLVKHKHLKLIALYPTDLTKSNLSRKLAPLMLRG